MIFFFFFNKSRVYLQQQIHNSTIREKEGIDIACITAFCLNVLKPINAGSKRMSKENFSIGVDGEI